MSSRVVGVVHAKSSSKRVENKNLKKVCGKPLFCYAVENSLAARKIDTTVVDSDSEKILQVGEKKGAVPLRRPKHLASNKATGDDLAYWQVSNFKDSDVLVQVVPTSPFIKPRTIDRAIQRLRTEEANSATTVVSESLYTWEDGSPDYYDDDGKIPNSYNMKKTTYETTGMYAAKSRYILESEKRLDPSSCLLVEVSKMEAVDINTEEDLRLARNIMRGLKNKNDRCS